MGRLCEISPGLYKYAFFQSLTALGCQFSSFRYSAVEMDWLDGWQIRWYHRVNLCQYSSCFCCTSSAASSRELGHKGWRSGYLTSYKNLRRQVIFSVLELHLCSLFYLVLLSGMKMLALLTQTESQVYFWKLLKNNWGVSFTFSCVLQLLLRVLKLKKVSGLFLALSDFHTKISMFLFLSAHCGR